MAFPATTPTSQPQASALLSNNAANAGLTNAVPFDRLTMLEQTVANLLTDLPGVANAVLTTGAMGFAVGAGGSITQATSKATGVTLSKYVGTITLNGAALAADTTVAFTWTNTLIAANDVVHIVHDSVGTLGAYQFAVTPAAGSASVSVHNLTPGSLSEAIVLRFIVFKGAIT